MSDEWSVENALISEEKKHTESIWNIKWYKASLKISACVLLLYSTWAMLLSFINPRLWEVAIEITSQGF